MSEESETFVIDARPSTGSAGLTSALLTTDLGVLLISVALRLPALLYAGPIDDEKVYAVVANEMLEGGLPYRDAIERKPPLLFSIYEGVFELAGKYNWAALHLLGLAWVLATMWGLYLGARVRFGRETGLAAAMLYGVYMAAAEHKNLAVNGELLLNLPVVLATTLVIFGESRRRRLSLFTAGVLLACGALIKQPAGAAAVALGLYTLLPAYRRSRGLSRTGQLAHAGILTLGALLTVAVMAFVLYRQGILAEAVYWSIGDHDIPHGITDPIFWKRAWGGGAWFFAACAPLVMLVVVALRDGFGPARWLHGAHLELTGLILLLVCSSIGAAASGRFYTHYFLQMLPALAWLGALSLVELRKTLPSQPWLRAPALHGSILLCALVFTVVNMRALWKVPDEGPSAAYVEAHSSATDRIFLWGQTSGFYLRAHRRPASRYIATFPLTGYIFGSPLGHDPHYDTRDRIVPGAWDNLTRDLALHPPRFIIDSDSSSTHPKYDPFQYPVLAQLLRGHYTKCFTGRDGIVYRRLSSTNSGLQRSPPNGAVHTPPTEHSDAWFLRVPRAAEAS